MKIKINYIASAYEYEMRKFSELVMAGKNKIATIPGPIIINLGGRSIPF